MLGCNAKDFFEDCRMQGSQAKKISHFLFHYQNIIGKGKFSQVYRGIDTRNNNQVAIKVINFQKYSKPNLINLLYQEAQIFPQLNHPNIVQLYSRLISQNNCYLVMELCKQKNLEDRLKEEGVLGINQTERIILDIFKGLCYLNEKGVVHRDLKTANILFSKNGVAKISDFGFAIRTFSQVQDIFVGTPYYMSPESMLNQRYSQKSDLWSFGIIIYELFYGYVPMRKCITNDSVKQVIVRPVQIDSSLPNDVRQFIERCLQLNSVHRWNVQQAKSSAFMNRIFKKYHIETSIFHFPINQTLNSSNALSQQNKTFHSITSHRTSTTSHHPQNNSSQYNNPDFSEFAGINIQYKEIVTLIHYCRLINKVIEGQRIINDDLVLWLLKIINFLNSDTLLYDPARSSSTESVLRGYYKKYYSKYGSIAKAGKNTNIYKILNICTNLLRGRNISIQRQRRCVRICDCLLRETRILKECLERKSLQYLAISSESQRVLNEK